MPFDLGMRRVALRVSLSEVGVRNGSALLKAVRCKVPPTVLIDERRGVLHSCPSPVQLDG